MKSLYLKNSLSDKPKISKETILLGPLSEQRRGGIKHTLGSFFSRPNRPDDKAHSFLNIASTVFAADKLVQRSLFKDAWTRKINVSIPVSEKKPSSEKKVACCLSFLTGDEWSVHFRPSKLKKLGCFSYKDKFKPDVVCLFSGGLDSLIGAINLLENGKKLILVGHHDHSFPASVQKCLCAALQKHYGSDRVRLRQFEVKILNAVETSTRSRSFLFVAIGMSVASSFGNSIPLYIPENGFIGINVPLTSGRLGSYSTRTTHPLFFDLLTEFLVSIEIPHQLVNPFRHLSKGATLSECKNQSLLEKLFSFTVSCAHATAGRWEGQSPGNCGYCFPCLIRRSSLNLIGLDNAKDYLYDSIGNPKILNQAGKKAVDLQSILLAVYKYIKKPSNPSIEVLKTGSLGTHISELSEYTSVFQNGISEMVDFIQQKGCKQIKRYLHL